MILERVQRRATKFILNDYTSSYKSRLTQINLFPLMYQYKLNDLLFFIKSYKAPIAHFDIRQFVQFKLSSTRSSSAGKLVYQTSSTDINRHLNFCRISRLWNALPQIDNSSPYTIIKNLLFRYFWSHFLDNFDTNRVCTFHLCCPCNNCTSLTRPTPLFPL